MKDLSGGTVRLSEFRGKVVLLDFWATYCAPCSESIPEFEKLHEEFGDKGLAVIGISVDAFTEHVPGFVKKKGVGYTILLDPEQKVHDAFGVRGLPTTVLIGRDGGIIRRWTGYHEEIDRQIKTAVRETLSQKTAS